MLRSAIARVGIALHARAMAARTNVKSFWRDAQFGTALVAAPVAWGVMAWMFPSGFHTGQALSEPARLLTLALVYPVLEEMVFRGLLQGRLRESSWGLRQFGPLSLPNVLTSVVFTVLHFFVHPPLAAVLVLAPSLVFGYFRDRYDEHRILRIGAPIALHVWYNFGYYLLFGMAGK